MRFVARFVAQLVACNMLRNKFIARNFAGRKQSAAVAMTQVKSQMRMSRRDVADYGAKLAVVLIIIIQYFALLPSTDKINNVAALLFVIIARN